MNNSDNMRYFILLVVILPVTWIISCSGKPGTVTDKPVSIVTTTSEDATAARPIKLISPDENSELRLNETVKVVIAKEGKNSQPDSVKIWFDSRYAGVIKTAPWEFTINKSYTNKTGRKALKVVAYSGAKNIQTITRFVIVYSDIVPRRYGYKIVKSYPHDREAFTQGLVYLDGVFYEGTGQETRSSLRKVDPETGEVLNQLNLETRYFGEGIAIKGEKLYQVTWKNQVGFVYNKNTFELINKVGYQTEGWGLTTMGENLVMSDGSNMLYVLDPESFTVIFTLEVYDTKKKVSELNELEYINGEIWANIWQTDLIARIDPKSGKVTGYVDLQGILKDPETDTRVNVLNGIAWDSAGNRIFVTGKNWPKLFEIRVTE
jgi:glutaminyl-peptide cyclotransferase